MYCSVGGRCKQYKGGHVLADLFAYFIPGKTGSKSLPHFKLTSCSLSSFGVTNVAVQGNPYILAAKAGIIHHLFLLIEQPYVCLTIHKQPIGPQWNDLKIFQLFLAQNPNSIGVRFIKKFPTHVFRVTFCEPF